MQYFDDMNFHQIANDRYHLVLLQNQWEKINHHLNFHNFHLSLVLFNKKFFAETNAI